MASLFDMNGSAPAGLYSSPRPMNRRTELISDYVASTPASPPFGPIAGSVDADVCVVGGGIAGCTTALRLSERGISVALLEQADIGSGPSGRNGGQALPGVSCGQRKLEDLVGAADARRIWDVTVEGMRDMRSLIS